MHSSICTFPAVGQSQCLLLHLFVWGDGQIYHHWFIYFAINNSDLKSISFSPTLFLIVLLSALFFSPLSPCLSPPLGQLFWRDILRSSVDFCWVCLRLKLKTPDPHIFSCHHLYDLEIITKSSSTCIINDCLRNNVCLQSLPYRYCIEYLPSPLALSSHFSRYPTHVV